MIRQQKMILVELLPLELLNGVGGTSGRARFLLLAMLFFPILARGSGWRAADATAPHPLDLTYTVRLDRPAAHLVDVEIIARQFATTDINFVLPAWAPGRYAIYDFAKNVQEFSATGADGHALAWTRMDKQTWRVEAGASGGTIRVRYRVFANDLTGSFSQVDSQHANLGGPSVFMYVDGHKPDPITLRVLAPADWKVISGFSLATADQTFHAANYDVLADTPLEISAECTVDQFEEQGKTIRIAVHTYNEDDGDRAKLIAGVRALVHAELAAMPPLDLKDYLFLFHFVPDLSLGDGMEHLNSTQIMVQGSVKDSTQEALETAAHEFFHAWNVKRLRPVALGPFDYTRENYSPSLWFAEGVTTYYSYLFLLQAGIWNRDQFLKHLTNEIYSLEMAPGRALMSAEASSLSAWFFDRSPQMQETNFSNTTISYYNKGALLATLLDLGIRGHTAGRKSLLDVVRLMYNRFYEAPPTGYYGRGRGFEEKDIRESVQAVYGADLKGFFDRYVSGTDPLPYDDALGLVGMQLRREVPANAAPDLGALVQPDTRGLRIISIVPGGAADRAGLSRDDLLMDVDDQSLITDDLATRLRPYPPGAAVPIGFERHRHRDTISVILDPPLRNELTIVPLPAVTQDQAALREAWLGPK